MPARSTPAERPAIARALGAAFLAALVAAFVAGPMPEAHAQAHPQAGGQTGAQAGSLPGGQAAGGQAAGGQPLVSPPLPVVPGTVPWDLLAQVRTVRIKDRFLPEFAPAVRKLDRQDVKLVGFMMPLQTGEKQSHFLLTVTSQTCAFCVPAGPEGMVEVKARTPVKVSFDPVVIAGRLEVLRDDPLGVYYRISDAEPVAIR